MTEGDLDVRVTIQDGVVTSAWTEVAMFRGFEIILRGKDPRAGLVVTPRICGICGGSHRYKACYALDIAWSTHVPQNATLIRNIAQACETLQSIPRYFYALFAVDLVNKNYAGSPMYDEAVRRFAPYAGTSYQKGVVLSGKPVEVYAIFGGQWPHSSFMVPGGQLDEHSEGPAAAGAGPANGMHLPTGVLVHEGRLVVADAWHHRLLVWDCVPSRTATPPDHVLGQVDAVSVQPNAGREPDASTFSWPFGIAVIEGRFHVADTGNRRVLIWRDGIPEPGRPADVVLGQPGPSARDENRGTAVGADSFRWPHGFAATGSGGLIVADAGNHRLLRWDAHPQEDRPADAVLGQTDFVNGTEFPYVSQAGRLRFPYGVAAVDGELAVADTGNNRVVLWERR